MIVIWLISRFMIVRRRYLTVVWLMSDIEALILSRHLWALRFITEVPSYTHVVEFMVDTEINDGLGEVEMPVRRVLQVGAEVTVHRILLHKNRAWASWLISKEGYWYRFFVGKYVRSCQVTQVEQFKYKLNRLLHMHKSKIQGPGTPGSPSSVWIGTRELVCFDRICRKACKTTWNTKCIFPPFTDIYGAAYLRMLES